MRKLISLFLALVIIVGLIAPIHVSAVEIDRQKLFNDIKARIPEELDIMLLKNIFNVLSTNRNNIFNKLSEAEKDYLNSNGIDEDFIDEVVNALLSSTTLILKLITDSNLEYVDAKSDIEILLDRFYNLLPADVKSSIGFYAPNEQAKIDVMAKILSTLLNEKIGKGDYNTSSKVWTSLDLEVTRNHIEKINIEISGDSNKPLDNKHISIMNTLIRESVVLLSNDLTNKAGKLLFDLRLIDKNEVTPTPTPTPGGGTGGGSPSTPGTTPTVPSSPLVELIVPEDSNLPVSGIVSKNLVQTTEKDGTTIVTIKESESILAIEEVRKKAEDREASVMLNLDTIEDLDYKVELTDKLIEILVKNNVDLEVKTADSQITIPASVLNSINIPSGSKLEFRINSVPEDEVKEIVPESNEIKRVVDLNLVLVKDSEEIIITSFRTYITVKLDIEGLGDKDKLAVYYLNEETNSLEFVTGKIIDNMIQLRLNHFSKYLLVESNLTFVDIKDHWSKKYVESMAAKNVINGYDDGTFRPNNEITRAEFAKMIVNALELDLVKYNGIFNDVKASDWYADYVATLVKAGLAKGYGDGSFKPNNKITRVEMAVILGNVLDMEIKSNEIDSILGKFEDLITLADWAKLGVAKVIKDEIMIGTGSRFNPGGTATRAEVSTAIYRLYNK